MTVYSYEGELVFDVTGDKESIPDVDVITTGIKDGLVELLDAARTAS